MVLIRSIILIGLLIFTAWGVVFLKDALNMKCEDFVSRYYYISVDKTPTRCYPYWMQLRNPNDPEFAHPDLYYLEP